jgi:hypothetical protein
MYFQKVINKKILTVTKRPNSGAGESVSQWYGIRGSGSSVPKCHGSTTLVVMDPGTPKWPPEKENIAEVSCFEELSFLLKGPEASPGSWKSFIDQQFNQHKWNFLRCKIATFSGL